MKEMKTIPRKGQLAVLKKRVKGADVIVAIQKAPDNKRFEFSFVRGRDFAGISDLARSKRVLPLIALDDVYVSLWHLAYGDSIVAKEYREELARVDRRAHDRLKQWLVPHMMTTVRDLGARAYDRPDDPEIAAEIHAAVRLTKDRTANGA